MRIQVNLSLDSISIPEIVENGRHYITSITANAATFATPSPPLASITTALNALEIAYNAALNGGKSLKSTMRDKKVIAVGLLTQLGHYVEGVANGSETIVFLAGMNVKKKGGRASITFTAKTTDLPFQLELKAPYILRNAYIWEMIEDTNPASNIAAPQPTQVWTQIGISIKGSFLVSDLKVGVKYWFRYATVGKDGQSGWSDPISKMITE